MHTRAPFINIVILISLIIRLSLINASFIDADCFNVNIVLHDVVASISPRRLEIRTGGMGLGHFTMISEPHTPGLHTSFTTFIEWVGRSG